MDIDKLILTAATMATLKGFGSLMDIDKLILAGATVAVHAVLVL